MAWMAWTAPTALFFVAVAVALAVMTVLELRWPTVERQGWLPIATTRGDRFFISLLSIAYIHAIWLAVSDFPVYFASLLSVGTAALLMHKG